VRHAIPWSRALIVADAAILFAVLIGVFVAANSDRMPNGVNSFLSLRVTVKNIFLLAAMVVGWPALFRMMGLYEESRLRTWGEEACRVIASCSIASGLAMTFPLTSQSGMFRPPLIVVFWSVATAAILALRGMRRVAVKRLDHDPTRVIIIGAGPRGQAAYDELTHRPSPPCHVVGFVDSDMPEALRRPTLGSLDELEAILMRQAVDEVFVTLPIASKYREIQTAIAVCERAGVPVKYRSDMFDTAVAWPEYQQSPVVTMQVAPSGARLIVKRIIDVAVASIVLGMATPIMLAIALGIRLTSRGPLLFAQERYGRNKRIFRMYKFRTMVVDAAELQEGLEGRNEMDGPVFKIANDPRVTRFGRFLRHTSLDELPQLVHVLTGTMSLVGPRPLPLRDVERFTRSTDMRRFSVHPGLTCLWQISGRNEIGFNEWVRLDLAYIDQWSLRLDLYILARTIPAVLSGLGAR